MANGKILTIAEKTETDKAFEEFTKEMKLKLDLNQAKKGDSWKTCDMRFLESKLDEEINEYKNAKGNGRKSREAVDIANICMMLSRRHFSIWQKYSADNLSGKPPEESQIPEDKTCGYFRRGTEDGEFNVCRGNEPYSCRRSKAEGLCHKEIENIRNKTRNGIH